jgi:hypothetical protein
MVLRLASARSDAHWVISTWGPAQSAALATEGTSSSASKAVAEAWRIKA